MAQKNRKRYQRKLDVGTLVAVLLMGCAFAAGACGFVQVKNAHIECANTKRGLEQEIQILQKELDCVAGRISTAYDRPTLAAALKEVGSQLEPIRVTEKLDGMPAEVPTALASLAGPEPGMIFINVENPSG